MRETGGDEPLPYRMGICAITNNSDAEGRGPFVNGPYGESGILS